MISSTEVWSTYRGDLHLMPSPVRWRGSSYPSGIDKLQFSYNFISFHAGPGSYDPSAPLSSGSSFLLIRRERPRQSRHKVTQFHSSLYQTCQHARVWWAARGTTPLSEHQAWRGGLPEPREKHNQIREWIWRCLPLSRFVGIGTLRDCSSYCTGRGGVSHMPSTPSVILYLNRHICYTSKIEVDNVHILRL